jgi:hypothetical protein
LTLLAPSFRDEFPEQRIRARSPARKGCGAQQERQNREDRKDNGQNRTRIVMVQASPGYGQTAPYQRKKRPHSDTKEVRLEQAIVAKRRIQGVDLTLARQPQIVIRSGFPPNEPQNHALELVGGLTLLWSPFEQSKFHLEVPGFHQTG